MGLPWNVADIPGVTCWKKKKKDFSLFMLILKFTSHTVNSKWYLKFYWFLFIHLWWWLRTWGCLRISRKLLNPYQLFFSHSVFVRTGNHIFFDFYHFILLERNAHTLGHVSTTEIYFSQLLRVEHYQSWRAAKVKDRPSSWCRRSCCVVHGREVRQEKPQQRTHASFLEEPTLWVPVSLPE